MGFAPRQLFLLLVFAYVYVLHIFSLFLSLLRMGNSFAWKRWKRDTAVSRKRESLGWIFAVAQMRTTATSCRVLIPMSFRQKKGRICFKIKGYCRFRLHAFVINLSLVKRNTYSTYSCLMNIYDLKFFFRF